MSDLLISSFMVMWVSGDVMWVNRSGRSPKMSHVSESLRSLTKNERPWDIAQDAHQKWTNERITCFFERIAQLLIFLQKKSDLLREPMSEFTALALYDM